jgi:hypothetical protein
MDASAWVAVGTVVMTQVGLLTAVLRLGGRIDGRGLALTCRMDTVEGSLGARIDTLSARIASLEDRVDDLGARLDGRIDGVATALNSHIDGLATRLGELAQRLGARASDAEAPLPAVPPGYPPAMAPDLVSLEDLPEELGSRVTAATAHAQHRSIAVRDRGGESAATEEYEVHALAGDRLVHMVLALRLDGSVEEATETLLRDQILRVAIEDDRATIEVDNPTGCRSIPVPVGIATALDEGTG